jgi:nitrogen fixation protein NifU and related proteins
MKNLLLVALMFVGLNTFAQRPTLPQGEIRRELMDLRFGGYTNYEPLNGRIIIYRRPVLNRSAICKKCIKHYRKHKNMAYSEKVIDHYTNPRNVGTLNKDKDSVGTGLVGAPECGDVMRLQIEVEDGIITDAKFKTFGCGSAIAASSLATEWLKGRTIEEAITIDNMDIVEELALPPVKIHCSVLAEDAIKAAINDYRKKQGLEELKFDKNHH